MCFAAQTCSSGSGAVRIVRSERSQRSQDQGLAKRPVRDTTAPSASAASASPRPRTRGRTGDGSASSSSRPSPTTMGVRRRSSSETAPRYSGAMQKSKSSSSVVQSLEKIWKTRSKSHSRAAGTGQGAGTGAAQEPTPSCSWTSQRNCTWSSSLCNRRVQLAESTPLLQLSEVERQVLQRVALAKLQALNLGVAIRIPSEKVVAEVAAKPKRRAYLLKRKALTTGVVDGRKDSDKDSPASGLVFGLPLSQCIENERGTRAPGGVPVVSGAAGPGRGAQGHRASTGLAGLVGLAGRGGASRSSAGAADDGGNSGSVELRRKSHHGSRASFSSLVEAPRHGDAGSVEDLLGGPMAGSVPGQLNSLSSATSCSASATDFLDDELSDMVAEPRLPWVPHVVTTCLRHLTNHGLHTLGIFRVSSSKKRVRQLREEFDGGQGQDTSLDDDLCPHDVATLLKEYFRDLPDPLLCRDLYQAFVQTQRIRNRRLQAEALQHLVQLLPPAHRDTLHSLLVFLGEVARNAADRRDESGEWLTGNRMDSSNLATLFAPNILHPSNAPTADELSAERAEERADTINAVRSMIDNSEFLFQVSAELLDEVYMHMMDSHPQALDHLLRRRAAEAGEDIEPDTEEALDRSERRVWSREEFLHERCATPADDEPVSRGSRRSGGGSRRRSRVDSAGDSADSGTASGSGPGVITASLKIPVPGVGAGTGAAFALSVDDSDIPYIEDGIQDGSGTGSGRHQVTVGLVRGSLTGSTLVGGGGGQGQRRRQRSGSGSVGSDSSTTTGGAMASQGTRDSAVGSASASYSYSSPPRNSSSSPPSWASSPPLSPDPLVRHVNYIPDVSGPVQAAQVPQPAQPQDLAGRRAAYSRTASTSSEHHVQTTTLTPGVVVQRVTFTSIGDALTGTVGDNVPSTAPVAATPAVAPLSGIGGRREREVSKPSTYQRILSSLTGHGHSTGSELAKSATTSFIGGHAATEDREAKDYRDFREETGVRDKIITPSISSIGGAVLRSKTADIERMLRISRTSASTASTASTALTASSTTLSEDKKKYTKRRHTRHIPETDALSTVAPSRTSPAGVVSQVGAQAQMAQMGPRGSTAGQSQGQGVWKRRELIASDPKRHGAI